MKHSGLLWKGLVAASAVMLSLTLSFAIAEVVPAIAAGGEHTLTLYADEGGSVTVSGQTAQAGGSVTAQVQAEEAVVLTAEPSSDEYVFAYWYTVENTPLSYEAVYSYIMPDAEATVHGKFFKNEDKIKVTTSGDWNKEVEGTYQIKSETEYNFQPKQDIPIYFEFVGEKWFNFNYNLSVTTLGGYYGYIYVFVDGLQYISQSFSSGEISDTSNCLRTLGNKYHRVEIRYQTPNDSRAEGTSSEVPTALEFTLNNISLKDESEYGTTQTSVAWDARLGEAYILPGIVKASGDTNDEFIIAHGTKLQNEDGSATVSVPVGVPIAFAIKSFEQVDSTIVPEQKTGVHYGGVKYGGTLASGKAISLKFDAEGKASATENDKYDTTNVSFDLKEIAIFPEVSVTKSVDNVPQEEETISQKCSVDFPYGKKNDLLVTIDHYNNVTSSFTVTSNGDTISCETLTGKTGFSLTNITENQAVVITYSYGEKYYVEEPFTFNVYIKLDGANDGLDSILSPISHEVTITNDEQYPWYFDPAGNGEGSFAFSSGISYQKDGTLNAPVFSQLGFTFKGNGSFTFEFHIDGNGGKGADTDDTKAKKSYAAYRIDSPIPTNTPYKSGWLANNPSWTEAPWGVKGFKPEIATNLGWGVSTSAANLMAPRIFDAETVDAKNFWYKVTISIKGKGDDEETSIYIAHAIGNKFDSSYACMSVRNVAFFSGTAYIDWDVQNAKNESGEATDITVKQNEKDATRGKIDAGSILTFEANPTSGTFYGWKAVPGALKEASAQKANDPKAEITDEDMQWDTENARFVSYNQKYNYVVGTGFTKIVAVIDEKGTYAVRNGNKFYSSEEVQTALGDAAGGEDKKVIVVDNVTLSGITVPTGVDLIVPFNPTGDGYAMGTADVYVYDKDTNNDGTIDNKDTPTSLKSRHTATSKVSWTDGTEYAKPVYTLTLTGENTINGTLTVGGVLHYPDQSAQGHTSGAYSQLILSGEGTKLIVGEGGHLDVYGRVTGEGSIDVLSGGKLTQPFMILDYNGGTNTEASFNAGVTPFKMYAMVNVQNKGGFTIHHGAELYGHASLYFWESITTIDAPFISYVKETKEGIDYFQNDALIVLQKGATAHIVYDDEHTRVNFDDPATDNINEDDLNNVQAVGKTTITLTGGSYADFMQFPLDINTTQVYFSVPYNFDITLKSGGTFDILHPYKMMPGSSFTVEEDATLTVRTPSDKLPNGLHVYDSFFIPPVARRTYPTGEQLSAAGYNPYASLIVNGKLNIQDGATFLGTVQTTNANGTAQITVGKNVTLSAKLFDGVATEYSCNYTEYTLNARIWVKTGADTGELHALEAGTTYVSTSAEKFTLTGIEFKYCNGGKSGDDKHPLEGGHNFNEETKTTADVSATAENALHGAWMIKHGEEHVFDWTPNDGEKPTAEDPVKTLTRECQVLGCTHKGSAYLLYKFDAITSQEYKGAAFSTEELVDLFKAMYKDKFPEGAEATVSFGTVAEVKNATTYTVTVGLTGASFLIGDALVSEGTFSFTVTPKAVSVKISDQSADYSGSEPNVSQTAFTFTDGEPFEGDTLGFVITKAQGKDCKAGGYEITAEESKGSNFANGNYTITITYTAEGHSVFTINKVTLKVTPDNFSSPEGEEPIGTFTAKISGFVNDADKEALEAGILAALRYTCGVTKESEQGTYDITVAYSGTLDNYDVDCTAKGRYTVTDPLFRGVGFKNTDAVTYDGNAHALEVTGHEALTNAKVVITYQKDGKPVEAENVKDAGEYEVTAVISAEGENGQTYTQTLEATLTIEKLDVHVTLLAQSKTYDGAPAAPNSGKDVGWKFTAEAFKLCGEDGTDVLGIRLSVEGGNKNAGKYTILTEKNENGNYNVIFDNDGKGLYSIEKKAVAVTIKDIGTTYGDGTTKEAHAGDYEYDKSLIVSGDTVTVTLNFEGVDLSKANAAGYPVTASAAANNDNYTFTFTEGAKWTVAAKPVTVNVAKKTVTYSDTASPEAPTVWSLAEGSSLVAGDDLGVHLSKDGTGKDAGNYAIVATWDNKNYAVTFTGLTVEDNGGYVIEKLDISDDVFFFWEPDGSVTPDGTTTLRVKFAGQTVTLHCVGSYVDGNETLHGNLTATLDKPTVDALGTFTVTATIEDKNYSGSKAFTVIVTNAEGYTQELIEKLQRLGELAEGISADDLKAENFADLKEINGILNGLTEEEKEAAAKTLEEYEALVEAWEELADTDDIVETAKEIADAPIAAMFGAAAMLTALAGLAYIALKGGIL